MWEVPLDSKLCLRRNDFLKDGWCWSLWGVEVLLEVISRGEGCVETGVSESGVADDEEACLHTDVDFVPLPGPVTRGLEVVSM